MSNYDKNVWLSKAEFGKVVVVKMCFANVSVGDSYSYFCFCFVKNQVKIMAKGMNSDNIKYFQQDL